MQFVPFGSQGGFSGFGGFEDIFDMFTGGFSGFGGFGGRSKTGPQKGRDLQKGIVIEFEEAAFGAKKQVSINKLVQCRKCGGSGAAPGTGKRTCPKCGGSGSVVQVQRTALGNIQTSRTCPDCKGTGSIIDTPCPDCGGSGTERRTIKVNIDIPAGVDKGTVIPLRGQGEPGANGGPAGDLYIVLDVKPHKLFERRGSDLYLNFPVSFEQAALGDEITVPTLGDKVKYKLPAGTQPGTVFRLKGKGIRELRSNRYGNLYVKVDVEVPTKLSSKQKKAIQDMSAALDKSCYEKKTGFAQKVKDIFGF